MEDVGAAFGGRREGTGRDGSGNCREGFVDNMGGIRVDLGIIKDDVKG